MTTTRKKTQAPTREALRELLFAAYNVGPGVEPDDAHGRNLTNAAAKTLDVLYDLMEGKEPGTVEGVLLTVRLLAETTCAQDPQAYAEHETRRGHTNAERVEDEGASIKLPRDVQVP